MRQISQELNEEVVRQLYRAKRACMKKRRLEEADIGAEMSQARRARLDESVSATDHNDNGYVDQRALEVVSGIAVAPIATFEDLVALELRSRATDTTDASAVAPINFEGTTQEFYPDTGSEPTHGGRYDPDITRITNWPAGWDRTVNQILGGIS